MVISGENRQFSPPSCILSPRWRGIGYRYGVRRN